MGNFVCRSESDLELLLAMATHEIDKDVKNIAAYNRLLDISILAYENNFLYDLSEQEHNNVFGEYVIHFEIRKDPQGMKIAIMDNPNNPKNIYGINAEYEKTEKGYRILHTFIYKSEFGNVDSKPTHQQLYRQNRTINFKTKNDL